MPVFTALVAALSGLILGSFVTAFAYRWPRGQSVVTDARSRCPSCQTPLAFRDLVPLFSWVWLKGRCRFCRAPIPVRYPVIEGATAILVLAVAARHGLQTAALPLLLLAPALIALVDIDLRHKLIPDVVNIFIGVLGFAFALMADAVPGALAGAAVYGLGSYALSFIMTRALKREALGLGDVKFFAAAGLWLGIDPARAALFLFLAGAGGVLLSLVWKKIAQEEQAPFGPALALALFIVTVFF